MSRLLGAALVLALLPRPAAAAKAVFPLFPIGERPAGSEDGYHLAWMRREKGLKIVVDGVVRYEGAENDGYELPVLSRDGRAWAAAVAAVDGEGRKTGSAVVVNGRTLKAVYASVKAVRLSPSGANLAFIGSTGEKEHFVVSGAGRGPSFETAPTLLAVGDATTLYHADWNSRRWLYRDHQPASQRDWFSLAASPDGAHVLGSYLLGSPTMEGGRMVSQDQALELDGKELGRWGQVSHQALAVDERGRWAAFAGGAGGDGHELLLNGGKPVSIPPTTTTYPPIPTAKGTLWKESDAGSCTLYLDAERIVKTSECWKGLYPVASPSGKRWAAVVNGEKGARLFVDGKVVVRDAPNAAVAGAFDGETGFHWIGDRDGKAVLVCVTLDERPADRGACARQANSLRSRFEAEASAPR